MTPRAVIAGKGHGAKANRDAAREYGSLPVIPYRSSARDKPKFFPKKLYRLRARVEIVIGRAKRLKRLAMRCEKTARNYAAIIAFVFGLILI